MASGGRVSLTNRCVESKSPYVRSHADNPTAWQLWEPKTIELARETNRLLFVSIGYSACHWCHVMAHESFDDPRIAQLLNENFIPVKIDREERPDIDRQYMDFQQATNGGGGWPLNVFTTPDLEPIFGGTYWPGPHSERLQTGGTGFEDILVRVAKVWKEQEQKVRENGKHIISQLREFNKEGQLGGDADGLRGADDHGLELDILDDAYQHYKHRFDMKHGGFGAAPKFPTPVHIRSLLRLSAHDPQVRAVVGEEECKHALTMVTKTLECMANGGIKDQIGHGFARYSVTRDWSLPHFEKMLYDNAQLLPLYLDTWLRTKKPQFRDMAIDIATYLTTKPMSSDFGGINASEDADSLPTPTASEKREGAFYVWTMEEMKRVLTTEEFKVCAPYWNIKPEGNIDSRADVQGELRGQNTLCIVKTLEALSKQVGMDSAQVQTIIESGRRKLRSHREQVRARPALDDKIVVSWNGLAVGGLAKAAAAFQDSLPKEAKIYLEAAKRAVACIEQNLLDKKSNTLKRVFREGAGDTPGFADDYAFLISGLLDLYEAGFDSHYLQLADGLQKTQIQLFWDSEKYAFFSTPADQPDILIRSKDAMDNAEPSTNGVSAANLFRLSSLFNDSEYHKKAKQTVSAFEVEISQHPGLFTGMLGSVLASKLGMKSLIVVGDGKLAQAAIQRTRQSIRPMFTVLRVAANGSEHWLRSRNDLLKDIDMSKDMVQLCEEGVCKLLNAEEIENLFAVPHYD